MKHCWNGELGILSILAMKCIRKTCVVGITIQVEEKILLFFLCVRRSQFTESELKLYSSFLNTFLLLLTFSWKTIAISKKHNLFRYNVHCNRVAPDIWLAGYSVFFPVSGRITIHIRGFHFSFFYCCWPTPRKQIR